jgi:hypothetical protein
MIRVVFFPYNYIQLQNILKYNPLLPWVLCNNPVFSTLKLKVIFLFPYIPNAFHNSISRLTKGFIRYHIIDIFIRLCSYSSSVSSRVYTKVLNDNTQLVHSMFFIITFLELIDGFHSLVLHNTYIIVRIIIFINLVVVIVSKLYNRWVVFLISPKLQCTCF